MNQTPKIRPRRRRGIILTAQGWEKLLWAKSDAEYEDNSGHRYTLEALSELTGLDPNTLSKVWSQSTPVDKKTLLSCFAAFNLTLTPTDYYHPEVVSEKREQPEPRELEPHFQPEVPGGQMAVNSPFYVEREPIETKCSQTIRQPGSLIRIKAAKGSGKSSLMARILAQAAQSGGRTLAVNFQLADTAIFQNLDTFLKWFSNYVTLKLRLPNRLEEHWSDFLGSKLSCSAYFENYLLPSIQKPLVLGLDEVDRLFNYPAIAEDFFGLLRSWHEEGKNLEIWQRLRLIIVHSTEVYIPLNVNKSPFNVGLPIYLPALREEQVQDLASRYQLNWSPEQVQKLMTIVGGSPYLVQMALYHIQQQQLTLEQLEQISADYPAIYRDHLQQQMWSLNQNRELKAAFAQVVNSDDPVELDMVKAFKLESIGLISLQGKQAVSSCLLYKRCFFQQS
ncbi:MAG: AAA-like domain-containing protein [Xenococcaceae cyanobacterium MO_234.B1]|nr:AAA-like domain-containing protein [Xenococcaceae cyanobacterium MO_234.B1]